MGEDLEKKLEALEETPESVDEVSQESAPQKTGGWVINSEAVVKALGLESPSVEMVSQGEAESVVKQGKSEFIIGNESLSQE